MAAAAAAAIAGGSTLTGAFNLGGQALANKGNLDAQNSQNDFNRWAIQNRENAFTQQNLPKFMAYGGGLQGPATLQHLGGTNYARTGMYGNSFNVSNGLMPQLAGMYNTNQLNNKTVGRRSQYSQTSPSGFGVGSQTTPIDSFGKASQTWPTSTGTQVSAFGDNFRQRVSQIGDVRSSRQPFL